MLLGHYAVAFLLSLFVPSISFWILSSATQVVDIAWGIFVMLDIEKIRIVPHANPSNDIQAIYMGYSHSLTSSIILGLSGFIFWNLLRRKAGFKESIAFSIALVSHFLCDLPFHDPDLPITFAQDSVKIGLGLWQYKALSIATEVVLIMLFGILWWKNVRTGRRIAFVISLALFDLVALSGIIPTPPTPFKLVFQLELIWIGVTVFSWWTTQGEEDERVRSRKKK